MANRLAKVVMTLDGKRVEIGLDKIRQQIKQLTADMNKMALEGKQNTREFKEMQKKVDKLHKAEADVAEVTKRISTYMKDLGNVATTDLRRAYRDGIKLRDSFKGTDKELKKLNADLAAMKAQIDKNTGATNAMTKAQMGFTGALKTTLKNLVAYAGVFAMFNKAKSMVEGIFESNLKLSDSLANIRKVSGLTMKDVNQLYTNISKIDTRNTIETLNELAYTGAKLGIGQNYGVQGLTGFVKAAEQVQMALGEDMGEKALPELAKMTEVMGLIEKYGVERSMQKAASAIFQLGATSTATGTNIVEFSKRLYGLANISNITADDLLALGSASDAMGLMPEVAATAFNKLFTSLQQNHNLIEKTLQIEPGTINNLYTAGKTMDAIVLILQKMKEQGNLNALGNVWKDLGSNGARLINVMATMSDRVDILKKHINTSRDAFKEGTAVINEYLIQNETAAAKMERASNLWAKAFTNSEGVDIVKQFADKWYDVSKAITQSESAMYSLRASLESIAEIFTAMIQALPYLIKLLTWFGIFAGFRTLALSVWSLITAINAARNATITWGAAMQTVMRSNVFLLALSAIAAGISYFIDKMNAASEAAENMKKRQEELDRQFQISKEKIQEASAQLETYKRALDRSNYSLEEKNRLLKDLLKGDYQEYLDYLGIEINSALDLASAYAMVVKVMKQKKAYEEREQYRDQVNGENKIERLRSGAKFKSVATGLGANIGTKWLDARLGNDPWKIVNSVIKSMGGKVETGLSLGGVTPLNYYNKYGRRLSGDDIQELYNAISDYRAAKTKEHLQDVAVEQMFEDEVGDFDIDKWQEEVAKGQLRRRGGLAKDKPDKAAAAAARAAAAAARKEQAKAKAAMIKQMEQAKKDSTALIDNIEAYYNLQQTAVNESVKDGRRTADEAKALNKELEKKKDEALYQARLALTGEENSFDKMRKEQMGTDIDMLDYSELSQKILAQIVGVNLEEAYKNLSKFDGSEAVYGVNAGAFLNEIRNKATEYQKKRSEIEVKQLEDMQKILESYDLLEKLFGDTAEDFIKLGFPVADLVDAAMSARMRAEKTKRSATGGADVDAKHFLGDAEPLIEGKAEGRVNAFRQMLMQFLESGVEPYIINPKNDQELARWFLDFASNKRQDEAGNPIITKWAGQNAEYKEWFGNLTGMRVDENGIFDAEDLEKTMAPIREKMQKFWTTLIGFEDNYYETLKKNYDRDKKLFTERWERSGQGEAFSDALTGLDMMQRQKKLTGADQGTHFGSMAGFTTLESDPEIAASMLRMEQARQELELLKQVSEDKRLIREQEQALAEAQMKLEETVMDKINERIKKLQEWTAPIEQFGESVGAAMGTALRDGEKMSEGIQNALKSMVEAYGKSTIKIVTELMMQRLKKKMLYRAMQADTKSETKAETQIEEEGAEQRLDARSMLEQGMVGLAQKWGMQLLQTKKQQDTQEMTQEGAKAKGKVAAGTAEGAADIIGKLGWWGIPLIAVITALLNGLLSMALNALFGSSSESSSSSSNSKNVKLVSGMLTYDSGNVQTVIGNDGQMYRARQIPGLPAGVSLITEPVATTVNGQPGLVGERGPELVIGRETTAAIMMNAPGLLQSLVDFDRYRSGARLYDTGNVAAAGSVPVTTVAGENAAIDPDTLAALRVLPQVMAALTEQLKKPVYINMFGTKGLYNELKNATNFMSKYGG